jgi:hypothetical protein
MKINQWYQNNVRGKTMEKMVHLAAWRCSCYLFSWSQFYKETWHFFSSSKNMPNIPVDNGFSFKALIIKPTRWFINITMIDYSLSLLYLLLCSSICNPPLLCTSYGNPKMCLPSIYNLTNFPPTDQIQPHLFIPINRIQAIASILKQEKGSFFTGVYLPQKSDLVPPL